MNSIEPNALSLSRVCSPQRATIQSRSLGFPGRLIGECLLMIAGIELSIMLLLPRIAAQTGPLAQAWLDTCLLTLSAAPLIVWRTQAWLRREAMHRTAPRKESGSFAPIMALSVLILGTATSIFIAWQMEQDVQMFARMGIHDAAHAMTNAAKLADQSRPALTLVFGMIIAVLLCAIVQSIGRSRARALELAEAMTEDLRNSEHLANQIRIETEQTAALLRAYKIALDRSWIVAVTDPSGKIIEVNDAFCAISRYTREELIGKDHRLLSSGMHPKSFWVEMWKTVATTGYWHAEVCNRAKDGTLYWVDTTISAVHDGSGKIEKIIAVRKDISKRKLTETALLEATEKAEAANLAKSEFLANMSHEIRTPLTAMLGYAEVLRDELMHEPDNHSRIEAADTIRNAGNHLLTVINDILDLSKIEAGKMTVERIDFSLVQLLAEVEWLIRPRAKGKGLALRLMLLTPIPSDINADPTRLRQILLNLLGNAVKFTEQGQVVIEVSIISEPAGNQLRLDVIDSGHGMDEAQSQHLFRPFSQADTSVTRKHGGTGLGLVICRRLAELMGGNVSLIRTAPGSGSVFRAQLPIGKATAATMLTSINNTTLAHPPSTPESTQLFGKILLVEDGLDNQRLITLHLRKAGATVDVAENGVVALKAISDAAASGEPFQLLVSDMQMPEMDGYTLAATLRRQKCAIPIIAITAHAMEEDRQACLLCGCDDFASKPINRTDLLETCARWLGKTSHVKLAA